MEKVRMNLAWISSEMKDISYVEMVLFIYLFILSLKTN